MPHKAVFNYASSRFTAGASASASTLVENLRAAEPAKPPGCNSKQAVLASLAQQFSPYKSAAAREVQALDFSRSLLGAHSPTYASASFAYNTVRRRLKK